MTLLDYIIDFVTNYLPFPYNIGALFIIVCFASLFGFYYKHNRKKVEGWENSNYRVIMYVMASFIILIILYLGIFYMNSISNTSNTDSAITTSSDNHHTTVDVAQEVIPTTTPSITSTNHSDNHFLVAISPFYNEEDRKIDHKTPKDIQTNIESTAGDMINTTILDVPPITDDQGAISQGEKAGADLVIYGGINETVFGKETSFYIISPNSSAYKIKQLTLSNNSGLEYTGNGGKMLMDTVYIISSSPDDNKNRSIKLESLTSTVYIICAFEYYKESKYTNAIILFTNITDYDKNAQILHYIGKSYYFKDEFNESLLYYDKAIKVDPNYSDIWNDKGSALIKLNKSDEALKAYDKAIEIDPKNSIAWYDKGIALLSLNRYEDARQAYDKANEINPSLSKLNYT